MARSKMSKVRKSRPKNNRFGRGVASGRRTHSKPLTKRQRDMRIKASREARKIVKAKEKEKALRQKEKEMEIEHENQRIRVEELLKEGVFSDFISKNIGKKAINVIKLLHTPQTDEKLAVDLVVKINEVRRILNVLDSYGVARYDTNKDSKGWLTFRWYLDTEKLGELSANVLAHRQENGFRLPDDCNDFFFCGKCYDDQKVIMPFDAAFENRFKCDSCGRQLKQLSKDEARALFEQGVAGGLEITTA